MKTRYFIRILLWALALAWLAVVLFLSSQNGEETAGLSLSIARFFGRLLGLTEGGISVFHLALRTAAHIAVYFLLGVLACGAAAATFPQKGHTAAWACTLAVCAVIAVVDEIRKAAIPGRHCSFEEAGLNVLGCVLGALLILLIRHLVIARRKKRSA
jgi:VanZ family protein